MARGVCFLTRSVLHDSYIYMGFSFCRFGEISSMILLKIFSMSFAWNYPPSLKSFIHTLCLSWSPRFLICSVHPLKMSIELRLVCCLYLVFIPWYSIFQRNRVIHGFQWTFLFALLCLSLPSSLHLGLTCCSLLKLIFISFRHLFVFSWKIV